ncbi:MAG: hypothetical protein IT323_08770 [Anaerolineae bacterium]|nr:hypothetical protein [Anaerolineae bacterium]
MRLNIRVRPARLLASLLILALLASCASAPAAQPGGPTAPPNLGDAESVARAFLDGWVSGDYGSMYALITPRSQITSREAFQEAYRAAEETLRLAEDSPKDYEILSDEGEQQGTTAIVRYNMSFNSLPLGRFTDEGRTMRLMITPRGWRVSWSAMDIFEGMAGGAQLQLTRTTGTRGRILDRSDRVIAQDNVDNFAVRLLTRTYPGGNADLCLDELARVFRLFRPDLERYKAFTGQDNGYTVGTLSPEDLQVLRPGLDRVCLLEYLPQRTRFYYGGTLGAQTIGFVGPIRAEQVAEFPNAAPDALVGQFGVERYWQDALGGQSGAALSIVTPDGLTVRTIFTRESAPGQDVRLTIDRGLQLRVEEALAEAYNAANWAEFSTGAAVVVLDVKTGEVLALASYPTVHPDAFRLATSFDADTIAYYLSKRATVNHATEETYSPASVMKVSSMIAAADSGAMGMLDVVDCTGLYTSPDDGSIKTDWIYLEPNRDPNYHGLINMKEGLTSSCDVYFWTLGDRVNSQDPELFRQYANRLGLGVRTGIDAIPEAQGIIPDPASTRLQQLRPWGVGDALNIVIGQGDVQVTVLQVARMMAAVANGETLPTPYLVRSVGAPGQTPSYTAQPAAPAALGIAPDVMRGVEEALCNVTVNKDLGTAQWVFWNFDQTRVQICGKTGTAESGAPYPHGWFAAYAGPPGEPEIAIAALTLYSREGSETSAPIVRRVIEAYYNLPYEPWPNFWSLPYEMLPPPGLGEGGPPAQ